MSDNVNFNELFNEIAENNNKLKNPLELLVGLANGVDLSNGSIVYAIAKNLHDEYGDELPDEYEYSHLIDAIFETCRFESVGIKEMLQAQKTLVEYQHPKRKSVEVTTTGTAEAVTELNEKEISTFWQKFDEKY